MIECGEKSPQLSTKLHREPRLLSGLMELYSTSIDCRHLHCHLLAQFKHSMFSASFAANRAEIYEHISVESRKELPPLEHQLNV